MKDLIKALKDAEKTNSRLAESQIQNAQAFNNHFQGTVAILKAAGSQLSDSAKVVQQNTQSYAKSLKIQKQIGKATKKHYDEIAKQEKEIRALRLEIQGQITDKRKAEIEEEIEKKNYIMAMEMKHAKRIADYRTQRLQDEATERENRFKEYQELTRNHKKNMEKMGAFGKSMGNAAKGGDLGGLATGGADGIASILKSLSGIGGKLGAVAGALGATVGVLGMFVALMFEADKKAKDMNKSIMNGASGLDLMAGKFEQGKITEKLDAMRNKAFDVGMQFRMSAEEVTNIMSAFNQASLRYDEMAKLTGESNGIAGLGMALDVAITKSKMLGVEANTVAEQIAQMNENFAMDLSQIDEAFSAIYMSAQTTGIATQKFFAMVTQVTGGMSLLNVDFAQTAAIAGELVESLGEAAGSKFLSDLANRGASMSYKDRLKSSLLSGGKTSRIGKKGVESRSRQLEQSAGFKDMFEGNTGVMKMLRSVGVAEKLQRRDDGSLDLQASLNKMSQKDRQNFMATIGNTDAGGSAEMERMVRELSELNIAAQRGDATVQMGKFNTGENLAQFLAESGSFVNLAKGQSMGGMSRMVLEEISGKSGMEVDQLVTMVDKMNSNMGIVKTYSEQIKGGKSLEEIAKSQGMDKTEFQEMLEKQYKLTIGEDGTIKSSKTGVAINNLEDYMINMGDAMESQIEKAMSNEDAMTSEIVANTASMSTILENMIHKTLNDIYVSVSGLWEAIVGDKHRDRDGERAQQLIRTLKDQTDALAERNTAMQGQAGELRQKVKTGKASEQEKAQLEMLEGRIASNKALMTQKTKERMELMRTRSYEKSKGALAEMKGATVTGQLSREEQKEAAEKMLRNFSAHFHTNMADAIENNNIRDDIVMDKQDIYDFRGKKNTKLVKQLYQQGIPADVLDEVQEEMGSRILYRGVGSNEGDTYSGFSRRVTGEYSDAILSGEGMDVLFQHGAGYAFGTGRATVGQMPNNESAYGGDQVARLIERREATGEVLQEAMMHMTPEEIQALKDSGVLVQTAEGQYTVSQKQYDKMEETLKVFKTSDAYLSNLEKFTRDDLSGEIGKEMMKAMVAEKLFEVATGAGLQMEDLVKAYATEGKSDDRKMRAKVAQNVKDEDEKKRLLNIMSSFNMRDGISLPDGTLEQLGKGHLIVTPNGDAIITDEADGVAAGTNIGKSGSGGGGGGGGIHIGTVVVKADDPETFKRKLKAVAKTKSGRNAMSGRSR